MRRKQTEQSNRAGTGRRDVAKTFQYRCGFTLIELLVVVALIALLFSLIGVAAMSAISGAKVKATRATIVKIQGILQQRLDAITRSDPDQVFVDSLTTRFGNKRRAEAMARKFTFRQAFPQSWGEVKTYYPRLLITSNETAPASSVPPRPQESAEVLYFILTKANVLGYPPESVDAFSSSEVRDTDSPPNGKLEFVDAWGKPLRFYRWPTRLIRDVTAPSPYTASPPPATFTPSTGARALIPSLPTSAINLNRDADDRYGVLAMKVWRLSAAEATYFEQGTAPSGHFLNGMGPFHALDTFSLPLIVSPGVDGDLGLYEPGDSTNFGYLAAPLPPQGPNGPYLEVFDNITNYNTRSGGK